MDSDEDGSTASSGSENKPAPSAVRSLASVPKGILTLRLSVTRIPALASAACVGARAQAPARSSAPWTRPLLTSGLGPSTGR